MENYTVYLVDKKVEVASDFLKPKLNAAGYLEAKPYFQSLKEFKNLDANISKKEERQISDFARNLFDLPDKPNNVKPRKNLKGKK